MLNTRLLNLADHENILLHNTYFTKGAIWQRLNKFIKKKKFLIHKSLIFQSFLQKNVLRILAEASIVCILTGEIYLAGAVVKYLLMLFPTQKLQQLM